MAGRSTWATSPIGGIATGSAPTCWPGARRPRRHAHASPTDRLAPSGEDLCHHTIWGRSLSTSATILPQMAEEASRSATGVAEAAAAVEPLELVDLDPL